MSDCETGWRCVEGTCRTDEAPPPADGSAVRTEPPRVSITADAGDADAAEASLPDGEPTDAASEE